MINIFNKKINRRKKGFTLIETLIAIFIFSASLVALTLISSRGISASRNAQSRTIAGLLAQEGVEFAYKIRNNNSMDSDSGNWLNGLDQCLNENCEINYSSNNFTLCSDNCSIYISPNGNSYSHNGNNSDKTIFNRSVKLLYQNNLDGDDNNSIDEVLLSVEVSWLDGTREMSIILKEYMTDWQSVLFK